LRPMRPKPLIATFTVILRNPPGSEFRGVDADEAPTIAATPSNCGVFNVSWWGTVNLQGR
jgi:hypothetical protein